MTDQGTHGMVDGELENYLRRVTDRLGAVPERDELVDELRSHLVEVRADTPDVELASVLGSPEAYADEMRSAAGLPAWSLQSNSIRVRGASVRRWLATSSVAVANDLRPFWWGLRGFAAGFFALVLLDSVQIAAQDNEWVGLWSYLLSPARAFDVLVTSWGWAEKMTVLVLLLVLGVVTSVWVGGRMARRPTRPWVSTTVVVLSALLGVWFTLVLWDVLTEAVFARWNELMPVPEAPISS